MLRQYLFVLVLVLALFPSVGFAQSSASVDAAREHFNRAQLAYSEERWLDCAQHFEQSFQSIFAPELLYNIGICYERAASVEGADRVDDLSRALAAYTRYIRELPGASDVVAVQVRMSDLRVLLERAQADAAPTPEPEVVVPTPEPVVTPMATEWVEPEVTPHRDSGFGFTWTTTSGALTLASFVTAIGLSVAAQQQFNGLAQSCGTTMAGCADTDLNSLSTLAISANAMYVVSGIFLAATGVAFGVEFHFWSNQTETHAGLSYSQVF